MTDNGTVVWTLGYGNRTIGEFIGLLTEFEIDTVVDIRLFPAAGDNLHFRKDALREALNTVGIDFHVAGHQFGSPRVENLDSPNIALNGTLRGFADYMSTPAFKKGVARLIELCRSRRLVIVNDKRGFEKCQRKLLADYLYLVEGFSLVHILDRSRFEAHRVTVTARYQFDSIVYDNFHQQGPLLH